jgi:hypothetical protein
MSTAIIRAAAWRAMQEQHQQRVDALLAGHLERAKTGEKHPVEDFLFTYYSLRPAQLRRWHPGAGVVLTAPPHDPELAERETWREYRGVAVDGPSGDGREPDGVTLDVAAFLERRGEAVGRTRDLLRATASRPLHLGCFGLHEWAMVYRLDQGDVRHPAWPLRLGRAGTDDVVQSHRLRCTHLDAYRFFTDEAIPLNSLRPRREDQMALEQPGCLHATMDLYKWAYKLLPAVPSDLVLEAFELARDVRELDMRAAPYDLSALGYSPVRIETPEGKAEYVAAQRSFAVRAEPLRTRLADLCQAMPAAPQAAARAGAGSHHRG